MEERGQRVTGTLRAITRRADHRLLSEGDVLQVYAVCAPGHLFAQMVPGCFQREWREWCLAPEGLFGARHLDG